MHREQPTTTNQQRLSRRDAGLITLCLVFAATSIFIIVRYFDSAFPEASIDFKYDRSSSKPIAEKLARAQGIDVRARKHAASFASDDNARIFLERSLGLERANRVMRGKVRIWYWHHRWFQPLVEEEISVDVAPTGEIVAFTHKIPEDRAIAGTASPEAFLRRVGVDVADLRLVSQSERRLPKRMQRIYTWESKSIRPSNAPYRYTVITDGGLVTSYSQRVKVPDAWLRSYRELRSRNVAAGSVDLIFNIVTMIAAVVVFIVRLRRGDLPLRFLLVIGATSIVLVGGISANSIPSQLAYYDTTTSYSAFIGQIAFNTAVQCVGTAMLLIVICGAGEVLYRERLPQHLAIPRLWTRKSLASKRVFLSLVLGYALVPVFIAYQVGFYVIAQRYGAWAPAEVPYDDLLNTAIPWVFVLFAGFFPAFSEEFLSRAFSIPFFQRIVRSRFAAIAIAAFIWGFGHSTYPQQPFWIRGVEVGIAGVVAGLLMDRFGLLPLLIWHYTIDAVYTATLLFASGNSYYVVSAAIASLLFAFPLVASIVLYVRNRGFVPDDDLTNATMPTEPPPQHPEVAKAAGQFPDAIRATPMRVIACVVLVGAAVLAIVFRPPVASDAIDYRITKERAKEIATTHVKTRHARVIATPLEGFHSWDRESPREEGGAPGPFDEIAAAYLLRSGMSVESLTHVFRTKIEAGVWTVRFFTPMKKEEIFVQVDPRTSRVVGYHKYQDEQNRGATLTRDQALAIARRAFATYGVDARAFDLKEALTFQQPHRRDWLFHLEERTPLAGRGFRRVTIRVAGDEVTQFNKTIKVPDGVVREAKTETLLNVVTFAMKIVGIVALLALVITGLVLATRSHGLPWRRALRWTAVLSIIPVAGFFSQYEALLFGYNTSVAWETFRVSLITAFVRDIGWKIGVLFLALAGLEAAVPYALSLARREGRARFGRSAAVAALAALAIVTLADLALQWIEYAFPSIASVSVSVPYVVAMPLPALFETAQALFGAIVFSAAVALYVLTVRKHAAVITIAVVFLASLDPLATLAQTPLMIARALAAALLVWAVARWVLDANPLAWPVAVFTGAMLQTASVLLTNDRPDLIANGVAMIVFVIAAMVWIARREDAGVDSVASPSMEVQSLPGLSGDGRESDVHRG